MKTFTSPQFALRVKYAREVLGITQDELARRMGLGDRQTVSSIESGIRAVKVQELVVLAESLDREADFFIDPFNVVAEAAYCWRAGIDLPGATLDAFEQKANRWVGLLRWLKDKHGHGPAATREILNLTVMSSFERAQAVADTFAARAGFGDVPADDLIEFIENKLNFSVLFVDTGMNDFGASISGAACNLGEIGVILVNRRESAARRNFDLAHELFHLLTWTTMPPERRESNSAEHRGKAKRIEQLADNFAATLLMPVKSLDKFIEPARSTDISHLVDVAAKLKVSTAALGWRLVHLRRLTVAQQAQLQAVAVDAAVEGGVPEQFSLPFVTMLHQALDFGWLSVRKAATTIGMTIHELNELFGSYELKNFDI